MELPKQYTAWLDAMLAMRPRIAEELTWQMGRPIRYTPFELNGEWKIYSSNASMPPHYVGPDAKIKNSMVSEGSMVLGEVENSVIFPGVRIGKGAKVKNSVIMPYTTVGENAVVDYAIVAQNCEIAAEARVEGAKGAITVVAEGESVQPEAGSKQAG